MAQTPRTRVYRGATREDAERAYHADARTKADDGYVPASEDWSNTLDQQVLTVAYVHAPERVAALLEALADAVPATATPEMVPAAATPAGAAPARSMASLVGAVSQVSRRLVGRVTAVSHLSRRLVVSVAGVVVLVALALVVWQTGILGRPDVTGVTAGDLPAAGEIWFGSSFDSSTFGVSGQTDSIRPGSSVALVAHLPKAIGSGEAFLRVSVNGTVVLSPVLVLPDGRDRFGITVGPFRSLGTYVYEVTDLGSTVLASGTLVVSG